MATRTAKAERRWRRIVENWRRSGLSAAAFGKRRGITAGMIYVWSSRLKKKDAVVAEATQPDTTLRFLPVEVIKEAPTAYSPRAMQDEHHDVLEIVLPRGVVIRVPPRADLSHLRRVVAALQEEQTT